MFFMEQDEAENTYGPLSAARIRVGNTVKWCLSPSRAWHHTNKIRGGVGWGRGRWRGGWRKKKEDQCLVIFLPRLPKLVDNYLG